MNLIQTEAVVLQAIPFKEYDRILTLFSPQGILKFFVKGKKKEYLRLAALTAPLTHGEYHFKPGRGELSHLAEGSILHQNLGIRKSFETLAAAEEMVQATLRSQWPGKPAPKLFQLFCLFIRHLPEIERPADLLTAFLLKVLRHEGLLQLALPLAEVHRFGGERYSSKEAPPGALLFSEQEEELLAELALMRSLNAITKLSIPAEFQIKVKQLFVQSYT